MKNYFNKYLTQKSFEDALLNNKITDLRNEIVLTLEELALNGILSPIIHGDIHSTNFSYAWNEFINQEISTQKDEDYLMGEINYFVEKLIIFNKNKRDDVSIVESFNKFVDFLNKGDFRSYCTPEGECFNCGESLKITFKDWKPEFFEFKEILEEKNYRKVVAENSPASFLNKMDYVPAEKCFDEFVKIKEVEFKTGNLIITDWIRLKEFNDEVHPEENIYHFNINCNKGRSESFEHYLKKGFISIVSQTGLDMYSLKDEKLKDSFVLGQMDYEKTEDERLNGKEFKHEGEINRGLRATTIIEEEVLVQIINERTRDLEKAKGLVKNYLKEDRSNIISKKIKPGKYSLIFDVRRKDVSDLLFIKDLDEGFEPKIYLYPVEYSPNHKNKVKKSKKM